MAMVLYNTQNREKYGYFGTPYPTFEQAVWMCFEDVDPWNDEYIDMGSEKDNIWLSDLLLLSEDEVEELEAR